MRKVFETPEVNTVELLQEDVIMVSAEKLANSRGLKVVEDWNGDSLGGIWTGSDWI